MPKKLIDSSFCIQVPDTNDGIIGTRNHLFAAIKVSNTSLDG